MLGFTPSYELCNQERGQGQLLGGGASCLIGAGSAASSSPEEMLAVRREEWSPLQTEAQVGVAEPTP